MARETVDLEFRANIARLQADLAKVPGITEKEAKKMVKALDSQLKRAEKSAKKAGKSGKKAFKEMEDSAGEADSVLQGLASGLDLIDPKLGDVARTVGDAAGGMEAMVRGASGSAVALGAVGAALSVAAGAYAFFKADLEEAEEKQRQAAESAEQLTRAYMNLEGILGDIDDQFALAAGEITKWDLKAREAIRDVSKGYTPLIQKTEEYIASLEEKQRVQKESITADKEEQAALKALDRQIGVNLTKLHAMEQAQKDAQDRAEMLVEFEKETAKAREADAQAEKDAAAALKAHNEAKTEAARLEAERLAESEARLAVLEQLSQIEEAAISGTLTGIQRITYERDLQLAQIEELAAKTNDLQAGEAAAAAVTAQAAKQIASEMDTLLTQADRALEEVEDHISSIKAGYVDLGMSVATATAQMAAAAGDVFGVVSDQRVDAFEEAKSALLELDETATQAQRDSARALLNETRDEARKMFAAEKAAAISQAIINGAVATVGAVRTAQANPIVSAALIAGVAATTAAQIAVIAAEKPTFHRGGVIGADPSERNITARAGEGVLTRQGVAAIGGPAGLAEANRGGNAGGAVTVNFRVGNAIASEIVYTGARGPGRGRQSTRALRPRGRTNPYRTAN